jgi:tRNA G46 methylase TrmB
VDDDVHVLMKGGQVYGATDTDDVFNMTVDGAENS